MYARRDIRRCFRLAAWRCSSYINITFSDQTDTIDQKLQIKKEITTTTEIKEIITETEIKR